MGIHTKLAAVQQKLKAPKDQHNSFGNYNYRSCEGILEAVKPIAGENGVMITLGDILVHEGDRYYIRATATAIDIETGETYSESAFAREEETKKGMDASQITGSASSYARKYALNGLLAIDDAKDADTDEQRLQQEASGKNDKPKSGSAIPSGFPKRDEMIKACSDYYKGDNLKKLLDYYHASEIKYLKNEQLVTAYSKTVKAS